MKITLTVEDIQNLMDWANNTCNNICTTMRENCESECSTGQYIRKMSILKHNFPPENIVIDIPDDNIKMRL